MTTAVAGISFMMRVRNEEQTLEKSVRSLFSLTIPYEIVLVLHLCTDRSREIAERLRRENDRICIFEYSVETSRAGYETLATDAKSPHSLMTYYNWCLNKTKMPWVFKWDGDFIASEGLVRFLNAGSWEQRATGGRYEIDARNSDNSNKELYLICMLATYAKHMFWETPIYLHIPGDTPLTCPDDAYIVHESEISDIKQHWTRVPWYTAEDSDEARLVQDRMHRLESDFGKEPLAHVRCGNYELDKNQSTIAHFNPSYVSVDS
uniref:Glycosyltransferase n=1 Tax=viral metagenome TaxID=1070528 RepID=A0A6C0HK04_9ZZZZ